MKASEFVVESVKTASAEQVWNYVDGIHPKDQQGGGFLKKLILRNPQYELRRVPLSSIHIPDQEYDDEEQDPKADPYNRVQTVDPEHAGEYSANFVDRRPIVVDREGWIIDGNHRAWAAANLLNKLNIMAWVPVEELNEISDERLQNYLSRAGKQVDSRLTRMSQARERLNKGWEIYDHNNPTRIIDRFEANSPREAQQYYQDYIDNHNPGDENFEFYLRRSTGIIEDAEPTVQQAHRDGLDLTAHRHGNELVITADAHGRNLAQVVFLQYGDKNLEAKDLLVDEAYRGQGIAAVMYDYAKALGYQVERSDAQTDAGKHFWDKNRGPKRVWETELDEIARIPQSELGGWGDKDTLEPMTTPPKGRKPLPGGSGYTYAVNRGDPEFMEIMIFDGDTLAAELDLFATLDPMKTWRVETVITDPDYRGRGLGKALYGIALSILRLTIEAGDQQTKFGQQMWLMLSSIPGVEVLGYAMESTDRYRPRPGDRVVDQNDTWTRFTFPVEPGKRSMRSTRSGTGIYSSQYVSMIAKWTGQ
jgi:GNAT superfamily N-acetyltransferase